MRREFFVFLVSGIGVLGVVLSSGCVQEKSPEASKPGTKSVWLGMELTDVITGDTFKVSDFKGKPVIMESFAAWCATCLEQQRQVKELLSKEGGDAIVHISLDTDPNEDEARVKAHAEKYGFDWYYAVSSAEFTKALIDEFGLGIVNAPGAPMVLICEDQSTRFLRRGVKSAEDLLSEVKKGC